MHRRALLVAIAGLSGCTSLVRNPLEDDPDPAGGASESEESSDAGGTGAGGEATPTTTPPPASPTPEGTPSATELRRMTVSDLFALSREQFGFAIEAYSDAGNGDSLTAVTAATDTFDPSPVVEHLYAARRAYETANRQGLPAEQREEIRRLGRVEKLLRLSIDTQVLLIEAHNDLEGVVDAIEFVDPESAGSLTERAGSRQHQANETVTELSNSRYRWAVSNSVDLSSTMYTEKRRQFRTETDTLADLHAALSPVVEGVQLFARARGRRQSGSPYAAASLAEEAETAFERGAATLRGIGRTIPAEGRGFDRITAALLSAADEMRVQARSFHRSVLPEEPTNG